MQGGNGHAPTRTPKITLTITLDNGDLRLECPITDKIFLLGALEMAKALVTQSVESRQGEKEDPSRIMVPGFVPPHNLGGTNG